MAEDLAGNNLSSARRFGISRRFQTFTDRVNRGDRVDVYRFRLQRSRSTFRADLDIVSNFDGRLGDATLRILDRRGRVIQGFNEVFGNGVRAIRFGSRQSDPSKDQVDPLRRGVYYLRVKWKRNGHVAANYVLRAAATQFFREVDDGGDGDNGGNNGGGDNNGGNNGGGSGGSGGGTDDDFVRGSATLVQNINRSADNASSSPRWFTVLDVPVDDQTTTPVIYFVADDGENGRELWRSETGRSAQLIDINTSEDGASSNPRFLTVFDGTLYFAADGGDGDGQELWRLDANGDPEQVADIFTGNGNSSNPEWLTVVGNTLYFAATDRRGQELWKLTAGSNTPELVADINGNISSGISEGSTPFWLVNFQDTLYFAANNGDDGIELWRSDGTAQGTFQVEDIFTDDTGSVTNSSSPGDLTVVGETLFFAATDGDGRELWKLTRDANGDDVVSQVSDIFSGSEESSPFYLTELNGVLYFAATRTLREGRELWRSDGTSAGTELVSDINSSASASSNPLFITRVGDLILFAADDGDSGIELWQSDGTTSGTALAENINRDDAGTASQDLGSFVVEATFDGILNRIVDRNGTAFFGADGGSASGEELWRFRPDTP